MFATEPCFGPVMGYPHPTMGFRTVHLKPAVAAATLLLAAFAAPSGASADEARLETLLEELSRSEGTKAKKIARDIEIAWSQSGSASANLLLKRGEDALEKDKALEAVEHFTAFTDHAPDFAEGWHGRARAFFELGEYGLALDDLQRTLALNPQHFGAIYGLGAIFETLGQAEEAVQAYDILLTLYPTHEKALEARARLEPKVRGTSL